MKIIYLFLDGLSYEYSWLNSGLMKNLNNLKKNSLNFHNHYSITHNTGGNFTCLLSGLTSTLTGIMGKKQDFRHNNYGYIQSILKKHNINSYFYSTCNVVKHYDSRDNLGFDEFKSFGPSLADYKVLAKVINNQYIESVKRLHKKKNYLLFLHYIDTHAPFETPLNKVTKKEYPEMYKFLYTFENIFYRIPRRFLRMYVKPQTLIKNILTYREYPDLKKLNPIPFGPVLSAERYKDFYKKCWENDKLFNDYNKMKHMSAKYLDQALKLFFDKIHDYVQEDTIFFISSDHGNNDTLSPNYIQKNGILNEQNTHIPLSIFTFNKKLKDKLNILGDIKEFTSHSDFFTTVNYLFNLEYRENEFDENLLNIKKKSRFIFSELNDTRFEYGHTKLLSDNNKIELRTISKDNINQCKLYKRSEVINSISESDYNTYYEYKSRYNKYFDKIRLNIT